MSQLEFIALRERPEIKEAAAQWFRSKLGVPKEAYLECMEEYLSGKTENGWYLCLDGGKVIGGMGVIENDFHERKDPAPNVCAVFTAAGAGMKSTIKDMADSLSFWGVAKIYKLGFGVAAVNWESISENKLKKIEKATDSAAQKILKKHGRVKPGLKARGFFYLMRILHKHGWNKRDIKYWKEKGWDKKKRPWK